MKIKIFRSVGLIVGIVLAIYLLTYCILIQRAVIVAEAGENGRSQMMPLAELRGFGARRDSFVWRVFEPAFYIDRQLIRKDYWATHWETEK